MKNCLRLLRVLAGLVLLSSLKIRHSC
jgi:hypothetical protein